MGCQVYVQNGLERPKPSERGEPTAKLQMNRLSLRNNRLKFKTSENLPINLEEFREYIPQRENPKDVNK